MPYSYEEISLHPKFTLDPGPPTVRRTGSFEDFVKFLIHLFLPQTFFLIPRQPIQWFSRTSIYFSVFEYLFQSQGLIQGFQPRMVGTVLGGFRAATFPVVSPSQLEPYSTHLCTLELHCTDCELLFFFLFLCFCRQPSLFPQSPFADHNHHVEGLPQPGELQT